MNADLPAGMTPAHVRRDRAIVIDTSHSQSKETLEGEAKLAAGWCGSSTRTSASWSCVRQRVRDFPGGWACRAF